MRSVANDTDTGSSLCLHTGCKPVAARPSPRLLRWKSGVDAFAYEIGVSPCGQVDTPWRKAMTKLEGDPTFEALDKIDRLEVFQEYIK